MSYTDFLQRKLAHRPTAGFEPDTMPAFMRADQVHVTAEALRKGRYAIFADCGLGKTIMELEWARQVAKRAGPVLIYAPLCVGIQTKEIGAIFGYEVRLSRTGADIQDGINITNYERMEKFADCRLGGIVLDESSILKNYTGATRKYLTDAYRAMPYKLCATATPAPNDFMEFGTHVEFLNLMKREEMLAMYFVHDGGETQAWRLKGHAQKPFVDWMNTWSTTYSKPSEVDPRFSDAGFSLPKLSLETHVIPATHPADEYLFTMEAGGLPEERGIRRSFMQERCRKVAELVAESDDFAVIWCELNDEGDLLEKEIPGSKQLKGADSIEKKEEILLAFTHGQLKHLITKAKITSFGLNWQHCNRTIFAGPSYSYEQVYQAIKRFHRFGQKRDVTAHFVMMDLEYNIWRNLMGKFEKQETLKEMTACLTQ